LDEHPLGVVRAPDADAIADRQTEGQQATRQSLALARELSVGQTNVLERHDQRLVTAESGDRPRQVLADGFLEQRNRRLALGGGNGHVVTPYDQGRAVTMDV